ncbi:MutS 1, partial [Hypsizygus marmoreus]
MVVLCRPIHHLITLSRINRIFRVSASTVSSKSTKTTKVFSDLPTALRRQDGTMAEPLAEWWGGPDRDLSPGHIDVEPPRKRRKVTKSVSPEDIISGNGNAGLCFIEAKDKHEQKTNEQYPNHCLSEPAVKPKRGRKPKVQATLDSVDSRLPQTTKRIPAIATHLNLRKRPDALQQQVPSRSPKEDESGQPQGLLAREVLENLKKFPNCLLLTRVGQFYESYFDQATEIAHLLNIKLTTRKWDGGRIPMCGFPLLHIDKHLKVLVQQNRRFVAMCEEFPRYSDHGVKAFERRVVRVITPGTLIDEPFLNPYENNYLLAISTPETAESVAAPSSQVGLAWIDVSTGEFFSKATNYDSLRDELARIAPREVVLDGKLELMKSHSVFQALAEDDNFVSFASPSTTTTENEETHKLPTFPASHLTETAVQIAQEPIHYGMGLGPQEASAVALLTMYLHTNLLEHMPALSSPNREGKEGRMQIDSHTIKALEIREGFREGGTKGSLLSAIKRTVTTGGSRLLSRWLCSPSTSVVEINARQALVAFFYDRPHFRADIAGALGEAEDTGRIIQKFLLGRGDTSDLLAVKRTTRIWSTIMDKVTEEKRLEAVEREHFNSDDWTSIDSLMTRMVGLHDLSRRIAMALEDTGPDLKVPDALEENQDDVNEESPGDTDSIVNWRFGPGKWTIKPGFSSTLTTLHNSLRIFHREREKLEQELQLKYDAPSLTLRASPAQGMHVHLARAKRDQAKLNATPEFISIAESGSTRCYFFKARWGQIAETTMALVAAEKDAFEILRKEVQNQPFNRGYSTVNTTRFQVNGHSPSLRLNAQILDELDVALALADLATEMNFVRPVLTNDPVYSVTNGRHPTVELGLLAAGRVFTPNSVELSPASRLHVITGPNMAGKSTFLRQTALVAILAQIGSFVPADSAIVGIVDKLFSRVGAKDDLFHDRSTFMVEMLETSEILRRATPRSLVIMDEVGRGTTVKDGLAIAYATLHHLVTTNQCRSLFATHFHELSDMLGYPNQRSSKGIFENVDFFCTDVEETDENHFAYKYRVRPGVNRDSHGLKVAQLAGMPPAAIKVAKDTLHYLRAQKADTWCKLADPELH